MSKKLPCYIVSDLLPLYEEDILSEQTKRDIDEHLSECEECKKKIAAMQMPIEVSVTEPEMKVNPFEKLKAYQNALVIFGAIVAFLVGIFSPIAVAGIKILIGGEITAYHMERFKSMGYMLVLKNCLMGFGACAVYLLLVWGIRKWMSNKVKWSNLLYYGVMGLYFVIWFWILFQRRATSGYRIINTYPFSTIQGYFNMNGAFLSDFALTNILGNIAIFVPMGIYLSLFTKTMSILRNTTLVGLISLGVEILQYVFAVGMADVDDLILNTVGGLIGVLLFKFLHKIYKDKTKDVITVLAPIGGGAAFIAYGLLYLLG